MRLRSKRKKGSMLGIAILVFAVFVVSSLSLTLATKIFYQNTVKRYAREQAYLSAKSILESIVADNTKLQTLLNETPLDTEVTVNFNTATDSSDEQLGQATLTLSEDANDEYLLTAKTNYGGQSGSLSLRIKKTTVIDQSLDTAIHYSSNDYAVHDFSGVKVGSSTDPANVYLKFTRLVPMSWQSTEKYKAYSANNLIDNGGTGNQEIFGDLTVEFKKPEEDNEFLYQTSLTINGLKVDGDLYVIGNTSANPVTGSTYGTDIILNNCQIGGRVIVIGDFHAISYFRNTTVGNYKVLTSQQPSNALDDYEVSSTPIVASGISEVKTIDPNIYADIPATSPSITGKTINGGTGTIYLKNYANGSPLTFDVSDGKTHKYILDCSEVQNKRFKNSIYVKGTGKVILYLVNAKGMEFDAYANNFIGANTENVTKNNKVVDRTTTPQLFFLSDDNVTFNTQNNGYLNAYIYGKNTTLYLNNSGRNYINFSGSFLGKTYYVDYWAIECANFMSIPDLNFGSSSSEGKWQVIAYE